MLTFFSAEKEALRRKAVTEAPEAFNQIALDFLA